MLLPTCQITQFYKGSSDFLTHLSTAALQCSIMDIGLRLCVAQMLCLVLLSAGRQVLGETVTLNDTQPFLSICGYPWMQSQTFVLSNATSNITVFMGPWVTEPYCANSIFNESCYYYEGTLCYQQKECTRTRPGTLMGVDGCVYVSRVSSGEGRAVTAELSVSSSSDGNIILIWVGLSCASLAVLISFCACCFFCCCASKSGPYQKIR